MSGTLTETFRTTQEELMLFGGACLLGIPTGVLFDTFRLLRRRLPHHTAVVAMEDMLWLTAVSVMLLCYASGFAHGVFRGYYALGCLIGFVLYECILGRPVVFLLNHLLRILCIPVAAVWRGIALICKKLWQRFVKYSKKHENGHENAQNHLQKHRKIVYNVHRTRRKGKTNGKKNQ